MTAQGGDRLRAGDSRNRITRVKRGFEFRRSRLQKPAKSDVFSLRELPVLAPNTASWKRLWKRRPSQLNRVCITTPQPRPFSVYIEQSRWVHLLGLRSASTKAAY
jgi:hypothetical protein